MRALTGAARHSGTDRAWVRIECADDLLTIAVRDAGSVSRTWVPGVGMSSMRERAAAVGGTVELTTNGEGSLLRALLPLG
jgi:signal transduction histidine kinase